MAKPRTEIYPYKLLSEHFELLKKKLVDSGLTFREIELNTGIPEELLGIVFSDKENVVTELSKLFEFFNIKIRAHHRIFKMYKVYDDGVQIRLYRRLQPKAWIYYDRSTQAFYNFQFKLEDGEEAPEFNKDLIISEMYYFLQKYLKKHP